MTRIALGGARTALARVFGYDSHSELTGTTSTSTGTAAAGIGGGAGTTESTGTAPVGTRTASTRVKGHDSHSESTGTASLSAGTTSLIADSTGSNSSKPMDEVGMVDGVGGGMRSTKQGRRSSPRFNRPIQNPTVNMAPLEDVEMFEVCPQIEAEDVKMTVTATAGDDVDMQIPDLSGSKRGAVSSPNVSLAKPVQFRSHIDKEVKKRRISSLSI